MNAICPKCGAETAGEGQACLSCTEYRRRNWLIGSAAALVVLAIAGVAFHLVSKPRSTGSGGGAVAAAAAEIPAEAVIRYNAAPVILRETPDIVESPIVARLPRATKLEGHIVTGNDEKTLWLKLLDGTGYVVLSALSEAEPPRLTRSLADKQWRSDSAFEIYKAPARSTSVIAKAAKGTALTLVGVTVGNYVEVRLANGAIGYVGDANLLLRRMAASPIGVAFNPASCHFGGELDGMLDRVGARMKAEWDAAEQKDYPTEEARNAAMDRIEGRSSYQRVERSFDGLLLTAVAQHYESQSLYFADQPAKVIETFRAKGFRIGHDGTFPATELYAGIAAAAGDARRYGVTDLGCGV